jgi:general secretion pathway protein J
MTRSRSAGFTLLEMLVALVIFGLLTAGLAQGTRAGLAMLGRQGRASAGLQDLDAVDRTLRRLIGTVDVGTRLIGPPHFVANARSMGFTADLPPDVTGFLTPQADVVLDVDAAHRLVLRWAPHYARPIGRLPAPRLTELLGEVDHIEASYWLPAAQGGGWVTQWQSDMLPALVRIRIVFPAGDARRWPDIVAATNVF